MEIVQGSRMWLCVLGSGDGDAPSQAGLAAEGNRPALRPARAGKPGALSLRCNRFGSSRREQLFHTNQNLLFVQKNFSSMNPMLVGIGRRSMGARAAQPRTALAARRCMCSEATPQADPNESGPFTNPSGPIRLPALPRGALLNMYFCLAAGARYARWALKALAASYIGASSFHYFCQKGAPPPSLLQDASTMHPIMASSQSFIISLIITSSSSSPNLQ